LAMTMSTINMIPRIGKVEKFLKVVAIPIRIHLKMSKMDFSHLASG